MSLPALTESRALRLAVLVALYLAQGLPWGFCSVGYVVLMTDAGLSSTQVGDAMAVALLPWGLKVFWGPLLDAWPPRLAARFGRRRPFVVVAQAIMALSLLALLPLEPAAQLPIVSAVLFVHNLFASMQDVAVDALAVDVLRDDERGRANAFMWAAKSAGVAIGGGGGALAAKAWGWSTLFVLLALAIGAIMALPLLVRERPVGEAPPDAGRKPGIFDRGVLATTLRARTMWAGVLLSVVAPVGYLMLAVAWTRFLRADLALSEERIAFATGVVENWSGVAGALVGGLLADRFGGRRVLVAILLSIAAAQAAFALSPSLWASWAFVLGFVVVWNASIGAFNAACNGLLMSMANPRIGATHFALYMALYNFVYSGSSSVGGRVVEANGMAGAMLIGAALLVFGIVVVPLADPRRAAKDYGLTA